LNIALDATYSLGGNLSGVGVYSRELLAGLAAAHPEAGFRFCYRPHRFLRSFREPIPANATRFLLGDARVPRSADVFHGLNQRLPRARLRRAVATFHDLFVLTGEYSTAEFRRRFADQAREAAGRADRIIAVSQFTARQVIDLLGVDPARVCVVHHGVRLPGDAPAGGRERIILHVGAIQRRKNIARLVDAFEKVGRDWQLVLAGSAGYGAPEILARIAGTPARERIRVLGYVPNAELAAWYRRAMIFAFPSLDEGFGMPVLEAMAAGTPVIASNRAAIPEVAGNAAWLVNPEDTGELAGALVDLSRDAEKRAQLSRHGLKRAAQFTWADAVEKTWRIYRELTNFRSG
jgi:glycosyltransferase involved in cell wall biosynthesis